MRGPGRRKVLEEQGHARTAVFKGVQPMVMLERQSEPLPLEEGPHPHSVLFTAMDGSQGHCALLFTCLWVS